MVRPWLISELGTVREHGKSMAGLFCFGFEKREATAWVRNGRVIWWVDVVKLTVDLGAYGFGL
jgi:hypothetical protein